ncbi:unnamed protein product [Echinostoma caproni]|uniref:Uncharacterized protein n=1 Tax=Echinostoma caproni TaxID=27848 RepID=A0A3P8GUT6_9TREM|nr:unnamed protein product [Echinostoma caproni]
MKRSPVGQRSTEKDSLMSGERRTQTGMDASFGVPPENPIYLDSDSDSLEIVASQTKAKHKPELSTTVISGSTTTASMTTAGTASTSITATIVSSTPGTHAPVTTMTSPVSVAVSDYKAPEIDTGNLSSDLISATDGLAEDEQLGSGDRADEEALGYTQSPRSHSPSLPLSFPLSEFDGSEASIVSSDASSLASDGSYYSNRSSECDCFNSGSFITSSQHDQRRRRHRAGEGRHHHRGYRDASWSRSSSSGDSFSGGRYSDYSNSEDSFDFGSSPGESPSGPVDEAHEAMLNQLKQQERKLRNELAKHRALANQLKEAQKRTHKLLQMEQLGTEESTKPVAPSSKEDKERAKAAVERLEAEHPKEEEHKTGATRRRTSRRRPKPGDSAKGESNIAETPSTSRSSDRVRPVRKTSAGRRKKEIELKEKLASSSSGTAPTSSTNQLEGKPGATAAARKEHPHPRPVPSESQARHRHAPAHRPTHGSKRGIQSQPKEKDEVRREASVGVGGDGGGGGASIADSGPEKGKPEKLDDRKVDESDTLVIANTAALVSADVDDPTRMHPDRLAENSTTKSVEMSKGPLETVHEVSVLAESQLVPTRKPWDDRDEDDEVKHVDYCYCCYCCYYYYHYY